MNCTWIESVAQCYGIADELASFPLMSAPSLDFPMWLFIPLIIMGILAFWVGLLELDRRWWDA